MWFESKGECCAWPNRAQTDFDVFSDHIHEYQRCATCNTFVRRTYTVPESGGLKFSLPWVDEMWEELPNNEELYEHLLEAEERPVDKDASETRIAEDRGRYEKHTHAFEVEDLRQESHDTIQILERCRSPECKLRRSRTFWFDYWETEAETLHEQGDTILEERRASLDATRPVPVLDAATEAVYEYDRTRSKRRLSRLGGFGPSTVPIAPDTLFDRIPEDVDMIRRSSDVGDVLVPLHEDAVLRSQRVTDESSLSRSEAWDAPLTASLAFETPPFVVADIVAAYALQTE